MTAKLLLFYSFCGTKALKQRIPPIFYSCGGFNTHRSSATLCVGTKGIKADCKHLMRTYNAKH